MRPRTPKADAQQQCGSVTLEFAFLLPALLMFLLGIMECGRLFWTYTTLYRATEAAARCGAIKTPANTLNVNGCVTDLAVKAYAVTQAYGLTVPSTWFAAGPITPCPGTPVSVTPSSGYQVSVNFPYTLMIPWLTVNALSLTPVSCYPAPT